jgi:hypothetical protein
VPDTERRSRVGCFNWRTSANLNLYTQLLFGCSQLETLFFLSFTGTLASFITAGVYSRSKPCRKCHRQCIKSRARQASLRRLNCDYVYLKAEQTGKLGCFHLHSLPLIWNQGNLFDTVDTTLVYWQTNSITFFFVMKGPPHHSLKAFCATPMMMIDGWAVFYQVLQLMEHQWNEIDRGKPTKLFYLQ